ncbi:MAG: glycosyltransferase family 2 protein, partial [Planctomycetes bacterium]|nr:glycosyltransferase family 2 protein [Planctomycetota bacterium]
MSAPDSVAVIVPAFNAAATLARGLASLQDQTHRPTQVIVVDDGSSDETAAIAERHGAQCLRQENGGPGMARNLGLEAATTEFVAFLDADDWYDPEKLARSIGTLRQLDAQCVSTDAWVVDGERLTGRKNSDRTVPTTLTHEQLLMGNPVVCSTVVARRESVLLAGGFDPHADMVATEDYDLWLRMAHREP